MPKKTAHDHGCGERKASTQGLSTLQQSLVLLWVLRRFSSISFRQTHMEHLFILFILLWYTFYFGCECLLLQTLSLGFGSFETF